MTYQLCKCLNCDTIMVDENPDVQPEFEIENLNLVDMVNIQEEGEDGNLFENFWACPICLTDGHLIDVTEESQLKTA